MKYITGTAALNLQLPGDETPGDWHCRSVNWKKALIKDSTKSVFYNFDIFRRHNLNIKKGRKIRPTLFYFHILKDV